MEDDVFAFDFELESTFPIAQSMHADTLHHGLRQDAMMSSLAANYDTTETIVLQKQQELDNLREKLQLLSKLVLNTAQPSRASLSIECAADLIDEQIFMTVLELLEEMVMGEDSGSVESKSGSDIYGQSLRNTTETISCSICERPVGVSRYAPHLEKCLGKGRASSRSASKRMATSFESLEKAANIDAVIDFLKGSDDEEQDEEQDTAWSEQKGRKKTAARKKKKPMTTGRVEKESAPTTKQQPSVSKVSNSSGGTTAGQSAALTSSNMSAPNKGGDSNLPFNSNPPQIDSNAFLHPTQNVPIARSSGTAVKHSSTILTLGSPSVQQFTNRLALSPTLTVNRNHEVLQGDVYVSEMEQQEYPQLWNSTGHPTMPHKPHPTIQKRANGTASPSKANVVKSDGASKPTSAPAKQRLKKPSSAPRPKDTNVPSADMNASVGIVQTVNVDQLNGFQAAPHDLYAYTTVQSQDYVPVPHLMPQTDPNTMQTPIPAPKQNPGGNRPRPSSTQGKAARKAAPKTSANKSKNVEKEKEANMDFEPDSLFSLDPTELPGISLPMDADPDDWLV